MENDEFEMRPITAGIGFHKRPVSLREHMARTDVTSDVLSRRTPASAPIDHNENEEMRSHEDLLAEIRTALNPIKEKKKTSVTLHEPLPRKGAQISASPTIEPDNYRAPSPSIDPLDKIDFHIPDEKLNVQNTQGTRRGGHDGLIADLSPISFSASALMLDAIIASAIALLFVVVLVSVTGVDLVSILTSTANDYLAQISLLVMFLAVSQMYLLVTRAFAGSSLGEWTFDLQVGEDEQIARPSYPIRVFIRSLINTITGLIVLPFLSLIIGKDIAGRISGVSLYRKN